MSTFPFADGQESSRSALIGVMQPMVDTGQQIVDTMEELRIGALLQVQRGLSRLIGYRGQALRAPAAGLAATFLVSDLQNTDQTQTTATVRADSASVSLRERKSPTNSVIKSLSFSSDSGTVEQFGSLYRVMATTGEPPVGTFDIQLTARALMSFLVIDYAPTPSSPNVAISVSADGVTYNSVTQTSTSGYSLSAWFSPQEVQYVQVVFSPTHPDDLGGMSYTFGITDLYAYAVSFELQSSWCSLPIPVTPESDSWVFQAQAVDGLMYFLSFDGGSSWMEVTPGQTVAVPDVVNVSVSTTVQSLWNTGPILVGQLDQQLPDGYFPSSVEIVDVNGNAVPLAPGLGVAVSGLTNQYIVPAGSLESTGVMGPTGATGPTGPIYALAPTGPTGAENLYLLPCTTDELGETFQLSYSYRPSALGYIEATLNVQLNTENSSTSPVFTGAVLVDV